MQESKEEIVQKIVYEEYMPALQNHVYNVLIQYGEQVIRNYELTQQVGLNLTYTNRNEFDPSDITNEMVDEIIHVIQNDEVPTKQ